MHSSSIPKRQASSPADNMRGSLFMVLAMAGFGFGDAVVKHLSGTLELGQTIFVRGLFATLFLFILTKSTNKLRPLVTIKNPYILLRAICEMLATMTFLLALFNIPIANTTAIIQAQPLLITLGAALLFGETIGRYRIAAIGIGFIGVLIIVRPGMEGFTIYSLSVLAAVFFSATRDLSTRMIPADIPTLFVALVTSVLVTLMGATIALFQPWQSLGPATLAWLACGAMFLLVGYIGIAASMRVGDVGVIVPFRYTILIYAIFSGIIFFDEYPDWPTVIGACIIVATGIYTFYRERVISTDKA